MSAFCEAIRVFAEKHLIPSVISLVLGGIVYLVTPEDFVVLKKLSGLYYFLLISGCIFLFVQLVIWFKERMYIKKESRRIENIENQNRKSLCKENLKVLWDMVDEFSFEDREYLNQFVKNENKPIVIRGNYIYAYGRLFNSKNIHRQEGYDEKGSYTQYILEDDFYNMLKISYELYGRISRF